VEFETRKLNECPEPVFAASLREGAVYWSVQYADENLLIPLMETLVFVGKNLDGKEPDLLYFQDIESYKQGIRHGSKEERAAKFHLRREQNIRHIFEFEQALEELLRCSLRRRKRAAGS
jgi:hypothetical protein